MITDGLSTGKMSIKEASKAVVKLQDVCIVSVCLCASACMPCMVVWACCVCNKAGNSHNDIMISPLTVMIITIISSVHEIHFLPMI